MKYNGARILIESLIENGVDTVFGYPGAAVLSIYDELYKAKNRIRHILVSHEQHAAHAADGYARSTGKAGVCIVTSGPGATNLVTGIATAFVDSVPLIAITGNVGTALLGKDSFQEVDIAGITMPIVKHNWIVKDVNELAQIVNEAFIVSLSGRPGPVLIDIPKDVIDVTCEFIKHNNKTYCFNERFQRLNRKTTRVNFNESDIENAASLINDSKRPMIYAGGGVINSGAYEQLEKFAERIKAPVALSLMGTGAFSRDHLFYSGLIGMFGTIVSNEIVKKSDLLIAIGARFSDRMLNSIGNITEDNFLKKIKIIHIDIDPAEINKNIKTDVSVVGDIKTVTAKLIKKINEKRLSEWFEVFLKWKGRMVKIKRSKKSGRQCLLPDFVILETAIALREDAVVCTDVGQHQIWTAQYYPFIKTRGFLSSCGMGTMGYGLGVAVGAKIANPTSPVVLFTGDGSFRMNQSEMATLVKYNLPVLIVIFNNNTLGMMRQWQKFNNSTHFYETDLENCGPDFVKLASAYGIQAFRTDNEKSFLSALKECMVQIKNGKPALIEAIIDKDEEVLPMTL